MWIYVSPTDVLVAFPNVVMVQWLDLRSRGHEFNTLLVKFSHSNSGQVVHVLVSVYNLMLAKGW